MSTAKILIVEDEPLIGLALQETLEKLGYTVPGIVDSADDLPAVFLRYKPDAIIMDIRLRSYTDGTDAARRLRLISQVPIIFLSAYSTEEARSKAARSNPVAFLTKPVDEQVLAREIERALAPDPDAVMNL